MLFQKLNYKNVRAYFAHEKHFLITSIELKVDPTYNTFGTLEIKTLGAPNSKKVSGGMVLNNRVFSVFLRNSVGILHS